MFLEKTLRTPEDLIGAGLAAPESHAALEVVAARYAIAVTPAVAALIDPADPADPIARQFLPDPAELEAREGETADPIGDGAHSPVPGIVHRYPDRVLLMLTHICATYCRFCFRRERVGPGKSDGLSAEAVQAALAYIAGDPQIWEVILSGGDPLVLSPRRLAAVMAALGEIDHVKVIRLHTRVPVVAPDKITPTLIRGLKRSDKAVYVALHANHPRELTAEARAACARLIDAGIPMLSQSVLLRGVNDDAAVLGDLMRAFVETRIRPYYLHQGDLAPGTGHLRVGLDEGQALMRALRGRISGLAQPTYVLDIPGGHGKVPVGPGYVGAAPDGARRVRDPWGGEHDYL
jgi:lysine 2,3-aminomutase